MEFRRQHVRAYRPAGRSWRGSLFRAVLVLCILAAVSCWCLVRVARAELAEAALTAGHALSRLAPPESETHRLRLNGEVLHLFVETVDLSMAVVLARAEAACRAGTVAAEGVGSAGGGGVVSRGGLRQPLSSWPLLRHQTPRYGLVACVLSTEPDGPDDHITRLRRFGETGDLAALGQFRYVYARRLGSDRVLRLVVYNPGHFRMRRLVPEEGKDAVGEDLDGVPRPQDAVRLLTARIENSDHELVVYRAAGPAPRMLDRYSLRLTTQGWEELALPEPAREQARAYQHDVADLMVFAAQLDSATALTLVRTHAH